MISRILFVLAAAGLMAIVAKSLVFTSASAQPGGFYPATGQESASITLAIDAAGGHHAAFTGYDGPTKDQIVYGFCSADDCARSDAGWQKVVLAMTGAQKLQLKLTSEGKPRLLVIRHAGANQSNHNRVYSYGECNSDCTQSANWTFADVAASGDNLLSEVLALKIPDRTFVLDGQDRPRFIFTDANYFIEPDHYGAFVMSCERACTEKANWTETDLALHLGYRHEQFTKPVLAAGPDSTLGVLANVYAFDPEGKELKSGLYFYSCTSDCTQRANWSRVHINEIGGGSYPSPTWDLAFTSQGYPRIAQFMGDGTERQDLSHELVYLWCNTDCAKEESWSGSTVQPGKGVGESADLVLDDQDRPRVAMISDHGELALATCDTNCETNQPEWRSIFAERIEVPQKERPQALPFHCDGEVWEGRMPSLSLRKDAAMIGYDIVVSARCLYKDFQEPVPSYTFHEIFHGTRMVTIGLPE